MGRLAHGLAAPARARTLPVLKGPGRGLRVRSGRANLRVLGKGEPQVEQAFLGLLAPGKVVYDIGANIGWYSLLAARQGCRVFAFDPDIANAAVAGHNASANGLAVTVTAAAVTDEDGWLAFLLRGSLMSRLEKDDTARQAERRAQRNAGSNGRMHVPAVRLDSWITQTGNPPPDVVKIDVEGAEVGVLRGMRQTLQACRPTLIIELHGTNVEVAEELDDAGYRHTAVETDGDARESPWWAHVLATPR
jgi:FkbM family methyltransferase